MTFLGVGVCAALIGVLVWLIVTDDPPGVKHTPRTETLRESIAGIWQVIRTPSMGRIFMMQLSIYPSYVLVVGLWGGPYLTHIYGYDLKGRGDILFVAALAAVVGSFFWGPTDRHVRPPQDSGHARRCGFSFAALALVRRRSARCRRRCCSRCSRCSAFPPERCRSLLAHGRSLVPPHLLGRTMTLLNIGTMGGGFVVQLISGALIELFPSEGGAYPLEAYRLVFGLQAAFMLVGWSPISAAGNGT